jgi:CHAT domain
LAEPSLALTLPKQPSELDDGLLTASEVAQLKLNADWVVLSACNTAAGDKPGAEALSGLARAAVASLLFYDPIYSLKVTHAVDDHAPKAPPFRLGDGRPVALNPAHTEDLAVKLPSDVDTTSIHR